MQEIIFDQWFRIIWIKSTHKISRPVYRYYAKTCNNLRYNSLAFFLDFLQ